MSDNLHDLNIEEEEQDELIIDVALLKTQMSTANTNITNLSNQTAGSSSSGLKSLIESNDVDIASIKTKTDFLTINEAVDLDNYDDVNTNLTSINTMLEKTGNDTVLKTTGTKIQFYQGGSQLFNSNEIKNLVDNISVTQAVDLDTMETNIVSNSTLSAANQIVIVSIGTEKEGIKNNTLASTVKIVKQIQVK